MKFIQNLARTVSRLGGFWPEAPEYKTENSVTSELSVSTVQYKVFAEGAPGYVFVIPDITVTIYHHQ
jgi:hypothetical protein